MKLGRFSTPIFFIGFATLLSAQTIPQRRANLPTDENIPEDPKFSRAPKAKVKKKTPGKASTSNQVEVVVPDSPRPPALPPSPSTSPAPQASPLPAGLSPGEALASVFHCLKLPPPFEQATIPLATAARLLLADPNAYTGAMSPWSGTAVWINKGRITKEEAISAPAGWVTIRWPSAELGIPDSGTVTIRADRPIIAIESWWSDVSLFGNDIPKLLLHTANDWTTSPRRLTVNRMGYREELIPATIPAALRDPQVAPLLKPFLLRAGKTEDEIKRLGGMQQ